MKYFLKIAIIVFSWVLIGCQKEGAEGLIDYPRKDIVLTKTQIGYVQAGNQFAFDWLNIVNKEQKGSWFVSPLSVQLMLGMLANGASETALYEICNVLGYEKGGLVPLNEYVKSFLHQVLSLDPNTESRIDIFIVNSDRSPLVTSFKDRVEDVFCATTHSMSFSDSRSVAEWINEWVKAKTSGMVKEIIQETDINPNLRSLFGNSIFFKGKWSSPFSKAKTQKSLFYVDANTKKTVPIMKHVDIFFCNQTKIFKQITLPYGNGAFQMDIYLPREGKSISDVISYLREHCIERGVRQKADVWLPKFETTTTRMKIRPQLESMGVNPTVFSGVNYTGIQSDLMDSSLGDLLHSAVIKVDESGSEAAAVTVANMNAAANFFEFHADHPFLYFISEYSTGAILFAGKYSAE